MSSEKVKCWDLQGVRGMSIIAVLAFHFFPKTFPNGFLGVDQFFVLSGYFMMMLLTKNQNILNFYIRRFRRIIPLYQLIILISLLFARYFGDNSTTEKSGNRAILLISNQIKTSNDDYFEKITNSIDLFTHTWSLSVEIQFYLICPFIYHLVILNTPLKFIISLASFWYFQYLPENTAFFNVFSRIWQFVIGMMVYEWRNLKYEVLPLSDDDIKVEKNNRYPIFILIFITVLLLFLPISLNVMVLRPFITISTAVLIYLLKDEENNSILSNQVLTFFGDISYSLYLIHWPIYCYYHQNKENASIFIFLAAAIITSIIIYQFFEKWYLQLSNLSILILSIGLIIVNLLLANRHVFFHKCEKYESVNNYDNITIYKIPENMTLDLAERQNNDWNYHDLDNIRVEKCVGNVKPGDWIGTCKYYNESENGRNKVMLIGNSWAANHGKLIYDECRNTLRQMTQTSIPGCESLYPYEKFDCTQKWLDGVANDVKIAKPDYLFLVSRNVGLGENFTGVFQTDTIYQKMLEQIKKYLENVKFKIYIVNAIATVNTQQIDGIVANIRRNMSFVEIDKLLYKADNYKNGRKRLNKLISECDGKCELIDYQHIFYRNSTKTWRFFDDSGLEYFTIGQHFSKLGIEMIRPVWRQLCQKL